MKAYHVKYRGRGVCITELHADEVRAIESMLKRKALEFESITPALCPVCDTQFENKTCATCDKLVSKI